MVKFKILFRSLIDIFRKEVLINCAKLENERSTLIYKVEDYKDLLEDQTELAAELKISLKAKCRDIEKLKMQLGQKAKDVDVLTCQVTNINYRPKLEFVLIFWLKLLSLKGPGSS